MPTIQYTLLAKELLIVAADVFDWLILMLLADQISLFDQAFLTRLIEHCLVCLSKFENFLTQEALDFLFHAVIGLVVDDAFGANAMTTC